MILYVGDDWSEDHHDIQLMNEAGEQLAARRLPEGVKGVAALHELIAQHASDPGEVVVGIETERGPWVSALLAAGYRVYAINPRSASRYRDRHHVGGAKSDAGDAGCSPTWCAPTATTTALWQATATTRARCASSPAPTSS